MADRSPKTLVRMIRRDLANCGMVITKQRVRLEHVAVLGERGIQIKMISGWNPAAVQIL